MLQGLVSEILLIYGGLRIRIEKKGAYRKLQKVVASSVSVGVGACVYVCSLHLFADRCLQ